MPDWINVVTAIIAFAALLVSLLSTRYVQVQADASVSATHSAVLTTIFSSVLTEEVRLIRAHLLFGRPVDPDREYAGQVRELFAAYNRAAMMIGEDNKLKVIFLRYQKDEIEALFSRCEADLASILSGPPPRPHYASALRALHAWGTKRRLLTPTQSGISDTEVTGEQQPPSGRRQP